MNKHKQNKSYRIKSYRKTTFKKKKNQCPRCNNIYKSVSALNFHIKKKHEKEVIINEKTSSIPIEKDEVSYKEIVIFEENTVKINEERRYLSNINQILKKKLKDFNDYMNIIENSERKIEFHSKFELKDIVKETLSCIYNQRLNILSILNKEKVPKEKQISEWNDSILKVDFLLVPPKIERITSLIEFISIKYTSLSSLKDISLLNQIYERNILNILNISSFDLSIDDALYRFFYLNLNLLNKIYLKFLLNLLCLFREYINMKFYLKYEKLNYTSYFSIEILSVLIWEFLCFLGIIENESYNENIFMNNKDILIINDMLKISNTSTVTVTVTVTDNIEKSSKFKLKDYKEIVFFMDFFTVWLKKNHSIV